MYATNYFEDKMLLLMRGQNIEAPAHVYLALFASDPGDTGTGALEVSYSGYSRQEINFAAPYEYSSGLAIENLEMISFAECPINYGTVTHVGIMDMQNIGAGNMLLYGQLDPPLNLQNGITPIFRPGSIKWIWSGNLGDYYRRALMNVFRGSSVTGFSPYIGLCAGDPEGQGFEFSGLNYSRIALQVSVPAQQQNGTDLCYNVNEILSPESTGNWGTLTHIAIYDAETNGNIYAVIPIGNTFEVTTHTAVGFHVGSLRFNVN